MYSESRFQNSSSSTGPTVAAVAASSSFAQFGRTQGEAVQLTEVHSANSRNSQVHFPRIMSIAGINPELRVLIVPDYIRLDKRQEFQQRLFIKLQKFFPAYTVRMQMSPGPFQDPEGAAAHFEMETPQRGSKATQKEVQNLRRDLLTSVFELARNAALHHPKLIWGIGQGAIIAAAYAHPRCFEKTLMTRNCQARELPPLSQAWGNVAAVVIHAPRIAKRDVQQPLLETAVPALFQSPPPPGPKLVSFCGK